MEEVREEESIGIMERVLTKYSCGGSQRLLVCSSIDRTK